MKWFVDVLICEVMLTHSLNTPNILICHSDGSGGQAKRRDSSDVALFLEKMRIRQSPLTDISSVNDTNIDLEFCYPVMNFFPSGSPIFLSPPLIPSDVSKDPHILFPFIPATMHTLMMGPATVTSVTFLLHFTPKACMSKDGGEGDCNKIIMHMGNQGPSRRFYLLHEHLAFII